MSERRVGDADGPKYPRGGLADLVEQVRWEDRMARPILPDDIEPVAADFCEEAEGLEPFDLGPVAPGEALVALAQFDEEPFWQLHIVSPKVNKNLSFKHRTLGRCSMAQLMVTLNTGVFYTEEGQLHDWTPNTYSSVWGNNALLDYVVRMLMPQKWREHPPIRSHCRIWPIYAYADETPASYRIGRGNGLVASFVHAAQQYAIEDEINERFALMLNNLADDLADDDPEE